MNSINSICLISNKKLITKSSTNHRSQYLQLISCLDILGWGWEWTTDYPDKSTAYDALLVRI